MMVNSPISTCWAAQMQAPLIPTDLPMIIFAPEVITESEVR
jgi:hypothetical protein